MEQDEWMKRYLKEAGRLGHLTEEAAARYRLKEATDRLLQAFPDDPEGAAIYVAFFAERKGLP
ncbi:MAG: hypothetical protein WAO35_07690 [Terriglobia bacterium]